MMRVRACTIRAGAMTAAADPGFPNSAPRSAENDLPAASAKSAVHSGDRSPAWVYPFAAYLGRVPDPQLNVELRQYSFQPTGVSTGFQAHAYPSASGRQMAIRSWLPQGVPVVALRILRFRIHKCNLLETGVVVCACNNQGWLLPPSPWLVALHQELLGRCSRHCYAISYTSDPLMAIAGSII